MTDQERPAEPGGDPNGEPEPDQPTVGWTVPTEPGDPSIPPGAVPPGPPTASVPPPPPIDPPQPVAGSGWSEPPPASPAPPVPAGGEWSQPASAPGAPGPLISASPSAAPPTGWASQPVSAQREIAPGLAFSGTPARFVAYLIDNFLLTIVGTVIAYLFGVSAGRAFGSGVASTAGIVAGLVALAIDAAYFIGMWTTRRATLGQMVFNIQVGNAFDGKVLSTSQAAIRWFLLSGLVSLTQVIAPPIAVVVAVVWSLLLLITTVTSPTKQGLHDRLATSAVVRPVGASDTLVWGCLIIFVILPLVAIVALIALGSQISSQLSIIGQSV